ncbi:hypothetical protein ACHAXR_010256 [Thalassiosira sp. AJA248-18]
MPSKNAPRFLDYRRNPLPLDVALSFALTASSSSSSNTTCSISARDLILSGKVHVNNAIERNCNHLVCRNDDRIAVVDEDDTSSVEVERPIINIALPRYFVCYKPRGVVCSTRRNEGIDRDDSVLISEWLANIIGPLKESVENNDSNICTVTENNTSDTTTTTIALCGDNTIKTVGRLDEESEGLLLVTNDGSFSRLLCDPEFGLEKTYRVVVRGRGYTRMIDAGLSITQCDNECQEEKHSTTTKLVKKRVAEMIERGNQAPTTGTTTPIICNNVHRQPTRQKSDSTKSSTHFPFESCHVLDVGKLPTQHSSDDSYYALVDLVLREGKRHAVRRIIKNAGLRVCFLSRISVEGLDSVYYNVVKPKSIVEAEEWGFLPGGRHRMVVPEGKLVLRSASHDDCAAAAAAAAAADDDGSAAILHPGHVMELRECDVDRIFALRRR